LQGFSLESPVIILDILSIWSAKIFVLLSEVQPWDKEDKNGDYERHHKSKDFVAYEITESFSFSVEKSGSHS
jgi:hypothetical protein